MVVPWEVMPSFKLHELTKSHTQIRGNRGLYTTPFLFLMNKARYESLSAEHQKIIDKNSGMALAKIAGRLWDEIEIPARKLAVDAGGEFHELSGQALDEIKVVANEVTEAWISSADQSGLNGIELVKSVKTLIKKYEDRSQ